MNGEAVMELLRENLVEAFPDRVVTRAAKDFQHRSAPERKKGVITLIAQGIASGLDVARDLADAAGALQIFLLAEFELPESADGLVVERAEWALWSELWAFFSEPGEGLCPLNVKSMQMSAQRSVPQGWLFAVLEFAELDGDD